MPRVPRVREGEQKGPSSVPVPTGDLGGALLYHGGCNRGGENLEKKTGTFFPREELKNIWDISQLSLACEKSLFKMTH